MYLSNLSFDSVSVVDTATHTVLDTIPVGDGPGAIAVDPTGSRIYVHLVNAGTIQVISTATGAITGSISIGAFGAGVGLAMHPGGAKLYVDVPGLGEVKVIATTTNSVIGTISVGTSPAGVVLNPAGTQLYVANQGSGTVSVVDTASDAVVGTITTGGSPYVMTVHPDGSRLYVGNLLGSSVFVVDTATNSVVTTIPVGALPTGISILPDGSKLYVVNRGDDDVSVISTATNTELLQIPVGDQPSAIGSFITGVQNGSASTIVGTGTMFVGLPSFTGQLTFDSVTHSVFGTPVNLNTALSGVPMNHVINLTGNNVGGLGFTLSAISSSAPFSLSGSGKITSTLYVIPLNIPIVSKSGSILPNGPVYSFQAMVGDAGNGLSGPFVLSAAAAGNTPTGSDVVVPATANVQLCPVSLGLELPVSVTFDSVGTAGTTLVTGTCQTPGSIPPDIRLDVGSFKFFFDVSTTADYTPPVTICGTYPDTDGNGIVDGTNVDEMTLALLHDVDGNGNFQPIANKSIDPVINRICGDAMSLSPFLIASQGVPKGFVAPDDQARKCENKLLKVSAKLFSAIVKCNRKAADAALREKPFDAVACEDAARAKYDDKVADLGGCPACVTANLATIRDTTDDSADELSSGLYCDGTTLLGDDSFGFVPSDSSAAACAKKQGKSATKLGNKLAKCYRKHADAVFGADTFDVDACLSAENAAYDDAVGALSACPACAVANAPVTRNRIERFSVEILSDIYCAGTTAIP